MRNELWPAALAMLTLPPGGTNVRLTRDHHGDLLFTLSEETLYAWVKDLESPTGRRVDGTWQEPATLPTIRRIQKDHPQMKGEQE